jgi:hypothetical protein
VYKDKLFLALTWIFVYVSVNFMSLWLFGDALGHAELFSVPPVCVTALGALFVVVFRAERFRDRFYTALALSAFGLSAVVTAAVSTAYSRAGGVDRAVLAAAMLVIVITLSVAAKRSNMKFLFALQSAAAMWAAHVTSGAVLFGSDWRAPLDIALMLAAFLWSRANTNGLVSRARPFDASGSAPRGIEPSFAVKRGGSLPFYAHNLLFPASAFAAMSAHGLYGKLFSAPSAAMFAIPAVAYIVLTIIEEERKVQWAFAAAAAFFGAFALASTAGRDAFHAAAAAVCATVAFARVPGFERSAPIQRALGFTLSLFAIKATYEEYLLWRAVFIGLCAAVALADAFASGGDKKRRCIGATAAYAFSLWFIADVMMWLGFREYSGFDLHKPWRGNLWLELIPVALCAVTTAVLAIESLLFRKRGTWKRATFAVAVLANAIFAAALSAFAIYENNATAGDMRAAYSAAAIVFGAAGCFVAYRREKAHADVFSALLLFTGAICAASLFAGGRNPEIGYLTAALAGLASCAAYGVALGRKRRGYSNLRAVWALSAFGLMFYDFSFDAHGLIRLGGALLLAANFLQYLRARGKDTADKALISCAVSTACIALAVWTGTLRADAEIFSIARPELTAAILMGGAFVIARAVWGFAAASHWAAFAVSVFGAALVYFGAEGHRMLHIAVVTVSALAALAVSLKIKLGRWFVFGFAIVAAIFFRETSEFWLSLKWWAYLLAAGLALVAIAAVNESGRRQGSGIMDKLKRSRIREWSW